MEQDDDIITIDSYEIYDSTNQIRPNRKMEDFSSFKTKNIFPKPNSDLSSKWNDKLVKLALEKGFKIDEILQAFKYLNSDALNELKMIDYLKSNRINLAHSDADIIEIDLTTSENANKPSDFCSNQPLDHKKPELNIVNKPIETISKNEQKELAISKANRGENDYVSLEYDSDSIMVIEPSPAKAKIDEDTKSCFNSNKTVQFTNKFHLNQGQNAYEITNSVRFDNTSRAFKNRKVLRQKNNNFKYRSRSNNERYSNTNYRSRSQTNEKNSQEIEYNTLKDKFVFF